MTVRLFVRWDWEQDCGVQELRADCPICPQSHAKAFYDYAGRLYRVIVKNSRDLAIHSLGAEEQTEVFDYFCDEFGRIVEKRSLDTDGNVVLIVRLRYEGSLVHETGWSPTQDEPPQTYLRGSL